MVIELKQELCDGHKYKWLISAGLVWLERHQERVNQLNVFPVPDGDTGTNMRLTMQGAYDAIAHMDEEHVGIVSERVAQGALRGARGNSGVILSQLLKGFSDAIKGQEVFDAKMLARACRQSFEAGYNAVTEPTEGTILTVARAIADAVDDYARSHDNLGDALDVMLASAYAALETTPDLLPVLKKAGVVDSGGQGLVYILEGMNRMRLGETMDDLDEEERSFGGWQDVLEPEDEEGYGYDVQFLMHGENMDVQEVRRAIDDMGWSTLVVGDSKLIKVHVHVHNPGEPLTYAINYGAALDDVVVENMQAQYEGQLNVRTASSNGHAAEREVEGVAVITVASGDGIQELFYDGLNAARVISGGQTMNPSAQDFLLAIDSLPNNEIVLLPNNKNIIMAAHQAASLARDRRVRVVETRTVPQGISAMLASVDHRASASIDEVVEMMEEASGYTITAEVTRAIRAAQIEQLDIEQGDFIGMVDGRLVNGGDTLSTVAIELLQKAGADRHELVTIYYGDGMKQNEAEALTDTLREQFDGLEFDIVFGGQPLYPLIISIE